MIGHNNPPDPLDDAIGVDPEALELAEGMLTGLPVTDESQMQAIDDLTKRLKSIKKAVVAAKEAESKPLHEEWKTCLARYKPTEEDLTRQIDGCVAMVDAFKRKLAAEKEAARKEAWRIAEAARIEAEAKALEADTSDIEAQREAAQAAQEAQDAKARASAAGKDTVKGMRKATRFEVEDYRAAINDIATNDKEAIRAFVDEYARHNHKKRAINGVRVWQTSEAF